jgi:hypothetical protein
VPHGQQIGSRFRSKGGLTDEPHLLSPGSMLRGIVQLSELTWVEEPLATLGAYSLFSIRICALSNSSSSYSILTCATSCPPRINSPSLYYSLPASQRHINTRVITKIISISALYYDIDLPPLISRVQEMSPRRLSGRDPDSAVNELDGKPLEKHLNSSFICRKEQGRMFIITNLLN